jgi:hypothetical protein
MAEERLNPVLSMGWYKIGTKYGLCNQLRREAMIRGEFISGK